LNISPKYRLILAVFLTALYAFIATPVQVWHRHHSIDKQFAKSHSFSTIAKNIQAEAETDCPVCTHHYSVFTEDSVLPELLLPSINSSVDAAYLLPSITGACFSFANKGPPQLV
jgi:hypothetical protein